MNSGLSSNSGDQPELSDELRRFAAELSRLNPRDDRLDRERLAFLAGRASVTSARSKPFKTLGLPLESRAWPAAFAAMTAVAATLLFLLVTRPEMREAPSIAAAGCHQDDRRQPVIQPVGGRAVLTARDVHFGDIETRLAKADADRTGADAPTSPTGDRNPPLFTPSAWQQVINESDPAKPLPRKSSGLSQKWGVTT